MSTGSGTGTPISPQLDDVLAEDVIELARRILNDTDAGQYHWADEIMLAYLDSAQRDVVSRRSDVRMNMNAGFKIITSVTDKTDILLVGSDWKLALAQFVVARALSEDDPEGNRAIAEHHLNEYRIKLGA